MNPKDIHVVLYRHYPDHPEGYPWHVETLDRTVKSGVRWMEKGYECPYVVVGAFDSAVEAVEFIEGYRGPVPAMP